MRQPKGQSVTGFFSRDFSDIKLTGLARSQFLIGHKYRFGQRTLGVWESRTQRVLYHLPVEAVVSVDSFSEDGCFVRVNWEGASLTLFTQDLIKRATLVEAQEIPEHLSVAAWAAVHYHGWQEALVHKSTGRHSGRWQDREGFSRPSH
jgi:hypothetical protein